MKTFSKIFASIMLLISSSAVFSQIELLYSLNVNAGDKSGGGVFNFSGEVYKEYDYDNGLELYNFSEYKGYFTKNIDYEKNQLQLSFYDLSNEKKLYYPLPSSPANYKISSLYITQHIFNNDDDFEFVINYEKNEWSNDDEYSNMIVANSKGEILKDFGFAGYFVWQKRIYLSNNQATICISKNYYEKNAVTEIYSVPTTINPNQLKSATLSNTTLSAFPNPAKTYVNLSYNVSGVEDAVMTITDASGRVVEQKTVNAMSDKLHLNVANYKRGMYFYEVQGYTGRFIVE